MLKQEYKEGKTTVKDALDLAIKVLSKTLDTTKLTSEKGIFSISCYKQGVSCKNYCCTDTHRLIDHMTRFCCRLKTDLYGQF